MTIYKTVSSIIFTILILLLVSPAPAQMKTPVGPIILKAAAIHTLEGENYRPGMLWMEDGMIRKVGESFEYPANAEVRDYGEAEIYPAFMHSRNLLGISEIGAVPVTSDFNELGDINPNVRPMVAFHSASSHIGLAASHGVAVVLSTPTGGLISGMASAMYSEGWTWEQMTLQPSVGLVVNWPRLINNPDAREQIHAIRDAIDKARRYHQARSANADYPIDVRWEAMRPVFDERFPVLVQADEISQIQSALNWAEDENINMILVGGRDAAYLADMLAEMQVPVILTTVIGSPSRNWEHYGWIYSTPARLHEAGVFFAIAADYGAASAYRLPHHASAAVAYGLPREEALKSITLNPARIFGLDERIGSIREGKEAHLIIGNGDPLEFTFEMKQVYIRGKKIDMDDKHQQLYKKYQSKQKQLRD